jgi:hypothetical protein
MQQKKRRSKKGVILLALAIALLVVAFVPAAAMAAPASLTVNNGATIIGSTNVHLTFNGDSAWLPVATKYVIQDSYTGPPDPGIFKPVTPASVAYVNGSTVELDYTMQSTATPIVGQSFTVRVSFFTAGDILAGTATATVLFDNTKTVSIVDFTPWGAAGDYSTTWFGPLTVPVRATATTAGAPAHSIVFRIDTRPWTERLFPWPTPVIIGGMATEPDGIHTVQHFGVTADTLLTSGPITTSPFGWDTTAPVWDFGSTKPSATTWYGNATIPWAATIMDGTGSGVAPIPSLTYTGPGPYTPAFVDGTPLPWSAFRYQASGTIPVGASLSLTAFDMVGNGGTVPLVLKWDLVAPHTSYTVDPVGADTISGWTNQDVTVKFQAVDGAPFPNSGVGYTEYVLGNATSTAPAQSASGTKLTVATDGTSSVVVTDTAPSGPKALWFRSVDKATPANQEVWQLVFIFIDKNAPKLSDDAPSWWINGPAHFDVELTAIDPNSGILSPPGIEYSVPGWHPPIVWTAGDLVPFSVDLVGHFTDGLYTLNYRASDRAGNKAEATQTVGIDSRAPVTDGAAGWINGTTPYVLTATDQVVGAGTAATSYRVDQATPWSTKVAATVGTQLMTELPLFAQVQGALHTIDFGSWDAALPFNYDATVAPFKDIASWHFGNFEGLTFTSGGVDQRIISMTGFKTRTVQLDITAPVVTAMDPKLGEWQKGPATVNFSGTDVGAGYAYTEWSTDGGTTWTKGEVAQVGGNGEITVTYHGVDKVGLKSANQTIVVKVASTPPTVTAKNASVKKGHKATFRFTVTSVTPTAQVFIQIRTKSGHTVSVHAYNNVPTGSQQSKAFMVNLPKGKYNIRIGAVDQAGNVQTRRGTGTLTVK